MRQYLKPVYDSRKSFYNKAEVETIEGGSRLYSYNTPVCEVVNGNVRLLSAWDYSPTTLRHTKEYLRQNGYTADSKAQIEKDYN